MKIKKAGKISGALFLSLLFFLLIHLGKDHSSKWEGTCLLACRKTQAQSPSSLVKGSQMELTMGKDLGEETHRKDASRQAGPSLTVVRQHHKLIIFCREQGGAHRQGYFLLSVLPQKWKALLRSITMQVARQNPWNTCSHLCLLDMGWGRAKITRSLISESGWLIIN